MDNLLFSGPNLRDALAGHEQACMKEIDELDENRVLNTSPEALTHHFVEKYTVAAPEINEADIQTDYDDIQIKANCNMYFNGHVGHHPPDVPGTRFTIFIPFTGDADLFRYKPSRSDFNPPCAIVKGKELGRVDS